MSETDKIKEKKTQYQRWEDYNENKVLEKYLWYDRYYTGIHSHDADGRGLRERFYGGYGGL